MAVTSDAKISFVCFLLGLAVLVLPLLGYVNYSFNSILLNYWTYILAADIVVVNGLLLVVYKGHAYQVAVRSSMLGLAVGVGILLAASDSSLRLFGWYLTTLAFFHWSEFFVTAVSNPKNLSLASFLLDHSREYYIAAIASVIEFVIEWYFFPGMKLPWYVSCLGLAMVLGGEFLRKAAMLTALTNFNHYVQHVKKDGHQLVTHGVYAITRHPSYVGWFYWSIGTQVMLCNPLCVLAYTLASWKFFKFRIEHEEITLLNFFGEEYLNYQKQVGTGIPLIEGYRMEL